MSKATKTIYLICFLWCVLSVPLLIYAWINHMVFGEAVINFINISAAIYTTGNNHIFFKSKKK